MRMGPCGSLKPLATVRLDELTDGSVAASPDGQTLYYPSTKPARNQALNVGLYGMWCGSLPGEACLTSG